MNSSNNKRDHQPKQLTLGIPVGIVAERRAQLIEANFLGTGKNHAKSNETSTPTTVKLDHPNRSRSRGAPNRRLPSKHFSTSRVGSTLFSPNKLEEKSEPSSGISVKTITETLLKGIKGYLNQDKQGSTTSEEKGWWTELRHGAYGKEKATAMETLFNQVESLPSLCHGLDQFFSDSYTRFHNHSLASYLLDALNTVLNDHALPTQQPKSGEHYSFEYWNTIKAQLEGDKPVQQVQV